MQKTSTRLADGRELIYYDSTPGTARTAADRRSLLPAEPRCELRYQPLLDSWTMYAAQRQDRSFLPAEEDCPLCPSREGRQTEVPDDDYEVVVFENRFPALCAPREVARSLPGHERGPIAGGELQPERSSGGRCEVVCYTSDHDASFAGLDSERVGLVIDALADRTTELGRLDGVEQVFCFENRGREIGVTQTHPHGQIYAYPFITPRTEKMLAAVEDYWRRSRRNLFDDLLTAERDDGRRVVLATEHWTAFVPHAARWPYELHCYPNRRAPDLACLDLESRRELPEVLLDIFGRFGRLFEEPAPYVAGWHQAPVSAGRDHFACHLELFTVRRAEDKLKYLAGSESGMDAFANDVFPEMAASALRELAR